MNGIVTDSTAWVYGIYLNIMEIYIKKKKVNKTNNSKSTRKPSLPCLYDCFYPPIFPSTSSEVAAVVFVIPESVFFKLTTYFIFVFLIKRPPKTTKQKTDFLSSVLSSGWFWLKVPQYLIDKSWLCAPWPLWPISMLLFRFCWPLPLRVGYYRIGKSNWNPS